MACTRGKAQKRADRQLDTELTLSLVPS